MRAFLEQTPKIDFLEIILTEKEVESLPIRGVCKEFRSLNGHKKKKKFINIFIRPETFEELYATEEGEESENDFGKYF